MYNKQYPIYLDIVGISVNEVTSLAGQSLEMLSFGDRNPKGTALLPGSRAPLIVVVAGNF